MTDSLTNSDQPQQRGVPLWMPITAVVLLLLGLFVAPAVTNSFSQEQLDRNALLSGISFLLIFIAIVFFYMVAIWWLSVWLNGRIPYKLYQRIEYALIGGIILGIVGMFQPWVFALYRYGFFLLLIATLAFIAWSHIASAPEEDEYLKSTLPVEDVVQ